MDFPTRDIRFITRGSPGGGHDLYTRIMAPLLEEVLGVNVVVENMTGGAGVVAADYMRNVAPDGYTVHIMEPAGLIGGVIADGGDFDFDRDFDWHFLGTVTQRATVIAVGADSEIQTWDELRERLLTDRLVWSTTGLTSSHSQNAIILFSQLGIPMPTFVPHDGTQEAFTALARGDGDFTAFAIDSVARAADNGDVRPLLHFSGAPDDILMPGVPRGADVGLGEFDGVLTATLAMVAPPDTPAEIVAILRDAFESVIFGEAMAKWAEETNSIVDPLTGAETEANLRVTADFLKRFQADIIAASAG